jgi:pullulanase-type alpha-1,6-glucosidase
MRSRRSSQNNLALLLFALGGVSSALAASCGGDEPKQVVDPPPTPASETLKVHYYRPTEDYTSVALSPVEGAADAKPLAPAGTDGFGVYFSVPLSKGAQSVRFSVDAGGAADMGGERVADLAAGKEIWVYADSGRVFRAAPAIPAPGTAIVYYRRADAAYDGWGLHAWDDILDGPTWDKPIPMTGSDAFGAYYTVKLKPAAKQFSFTLHQGDAKDPGPDMHVEVATQGRRVWIASGDTTIHTFPAEPPLVDGARAHWVTADTIAWNLAGDDASLMATKFALHYAASGGIKGDDNGKLVGAEADLPLTFDPAGLDAAVKARFPHLATYKALRLAPADAIKAKPWLEGQLVVSGERQGALFATGMQIPGVLDSLYAYSGPLGATWSGGVPTLRVWAPTARKVSLHLFADGKPATTAEVIPMSEDNGVWSVAGQAGWKGKYYLYEVEVFVPSTGKVETNLVTDPYSVSLATNSTRSQIVDLSAPELLPQGWASLAKPELAGFQDVSIYELHVRDFSMNDPTVSEPNRGTFLAFTEAGSNGMKHLSALAKAGLTHLHLLPVFDITTIQEVKANQKSPPDLSGFAPDGTEQQEAIAQIKDQDGFNWGYDPFHFTVPEGSYASDPEGSARILDFRKMVAGINGAGLRVVMDVVYNHTTVSGQDPRSVLDRVVPGYYFRLNAAGAVETSTCCQNTASEHTMMEKLMVDSLVTWARDYKVDGFRFDLMGHHMKSNLLNIRKALDALTVAKDGIDGAKVFLYGEGWDFGEVAGNARGVNATQKNMAGTGIATFNDRIRDALRGGGPFDSGDNLKKQGFVSGLYTDPNALDQGTAAEQKDRLLLLSDQLRVSLAGNLAEYTFEDRTGTVVKGSAIDYNGAPAGYTAAPLEAINYAEAHDNQTLFDILQYKLPDKTTMADRVRMQNLAVSVVGLSQGVPFFHAGIDMLRSKSLDRDSFNSGDWFNRLDFSYATNNWGVGLPPKDGNEANWPIMKPLLADAARKPAGADIVRAAEHMREVLQIRRSTPLLRLATADDVMARLRFYNTGKDQTPGLIVMAISDEVQGAADLDPALEAVVVLFNATPDAVEYTHADFAASVLALHPVQLASGDDVVKQAAFAAGKFSIPGRTAAVFVGTGNFPSP